MLEELRKLKKLQFCDEQIYRREEELDALPEERESLEALIKEMEDRVNELRNGVAMQQEELRKRNDILIRGEEKLKAITGKQSAIRNKEEYNALLREIDNIKRFNKEIEEEISEIGHEMEIKIQELKLAEEEHLKKIAGYRQRLDENKKRATQLEREIDRMYDERDKIAAGIPRALLRKYERIIEHADGGRALAEASDYVCRGCNMTLPPQLYHDVLKAEKATVFRMEAIRTCPHCQRILVPPENSQDKQKETDPRNKTECSSVCDDK